MSRALVQILSLRPKSNSGVVYARRFLPELVRAYGPSDVTILCDEFGRSCVGDPGCRFDVVRTPDWRLARKLAIRRHLPRAIARSGARVVLVPDVPAIDARIDVPAVLVVHAHIHLSQPQGQHWGRQLYWKLWFAREFVRDVKAAAAIVAPTEALARELDALVPGTLAKTRVVHHGVAPAFTPAPPGAPRPPLDAKRVLFVGNAMSYKNPAGALRIFAEATRGTDVRLRMAGVAPAELAELSREAGLAQDTLARVDALGRLDETGVVDECRAATALLLPSRLESFGLPALEAMATGLPVACSDLPALAEVTGGAALLASPDDVPAFAANLRLLLDDASEASRLRAAGLARAAHFTWRAAGEKVAALLSTLTCRV